MFSSDEEEEKSNIPCVDIFQLHAMLQPTLIYCLLLANLMSCLMSFFQALYSLLLRDIESMRCM